MQEINTEYKNLVLTFGCMNTSGIIFGSRAVVICLKLQGKEFRKDT